MLELLPLLLGLSSQLDPTNIQNYETNGDQCHWFVFFHGQYLESVLGAIHLSIQDLKAYFRGI